MAGWWSDPVPDFIDGTERLRGAMLHTISIARTDDEIRGCFPIVAELRPHLVEEDFVPTVRRLMREQRYFLAYLLDGGVKAVAGIRTGEWLHSGRYLEVEEFVTTHASRSLGYGARFFDWVLRYAAEHECSQVRLVSAVSRGDAHRFYVRQGMSHDAHYFAMDVPRDRTG